MAGLREGIKQEAEMSSDRLKRKTFSKEFTGNQWPYIPPEKMG
jgi:hypothetical protein